MQHSFLLGDAKDLVWVAVLWERFNSSGDFSEEDFLAVLASSVVMLFIHVSHQSAVGWNSLLLP